jgi:hypothetical protein
MTDNRDHPTPSPSREQAKRIIDRAVVEWPMVISPETSSYDDLIDAIAAALAERGARQGCIIDDKGVERKVLGTLPVTADGLVAGFPPGYGSLWGKGRHVEIDRFDPLCMFYDASTRSIFVRVTGLHGGIEFDGRPIGSLYSTLEAAQAAAAAGEGKVI